jgi:hypothetical protein
MKRLILLIFGLASIYNICAQIDDNNKNLKYHPSVFFCRNDSVFKARIYINDYNTFDSIKVGFIQKTLRPKNSKSICNYARYRKSIPSRLYRKIKEDVQADFQCKLTGIYSTRRCNDIVKEIYFFGISFSYKNNDVP